MASSSSFDVVSDFDRQEMVNAVDQVLREVKNRYDLKNTNSTVELEGDQITITTDSDMTLDTLGGILREKAAKRKLSQKIFDYGQPENVSGGRVRQEITLKRGIEKELAKTISKLVRDQKMKVQAAVQGDAVRVSSKSKNDLQTIMQLLREQDYPVDLQFENYR